MKNRPFFLGRRFMALFLYWCAGFSSFYISSFYSQHAINFDTIGACSALWPLTMPITMPLTFVAAFSDDYREQYPAFFSVGFFIGCLLLSSSLIRFDSWKIKVILRSLGIFLINFYSLDLFLRSLSV